MENEDNKPNFVCYNCKQKNYYNPSDYADRKEGKQLLMEMLTYKTKQVIINCRNPKCRSQNKVTV
jgi:hypothetical protein